MRNYIYIRSKVQTPGEEVTEDGPMSELPESHIGEDIQSTPDTGHLIQNQRALTHGRRHKPKQYPDYVLWSQVVKGNAVERIKRFSLSKGREIDIDCYIIYQQLDSTF